MLALAPIQPMTLIRVLILTAHFSLSLLTPAFSQEQDSYRVRAQMEQLESKVSRLDHDLRNASNTGLVAFLFGVFCALWAQNTGRSAWLWFFLGLFFNFITVLFLLTKNSNDNFRKRKLGRIS